jgi:ABC-type iron transport system FetAB ATPase subunit
MGDLKIIKTICFLVVSGETMKLCYPSLLGESLLDTQMQANLDQRAMVQLA